MKCNHRVLITLSGLLWLAIGTFLLFIGLRFLTTSLLVVSPGFSVASLMRSLPFSPENQAVCLMALAIFLGSFKGRFLLSKSAKRQLARIASLPNPAPLRLIYGKGYYLLIALMMSMGGVMRLLPISLDTRGVIDIVIGSALIQGSLFYFKAKSSVEKKV